MQYEKQSKSVPRALLTNNHNNTHFEIAFCGFSWGENKAIKKIEEKKRKREEYAKPHTGREGLSYWKIGLTTMAATQKLLSGMPLVFLKKKIHLPMEQYIT